MFPNKQSKSQTQRQSGSNQSKFMTGNNLTSTGSTDLPPQFFNKSGPIKISHNRTGMSNQNTSTQSQQ